jgi:hypothetical protein
MNQQVKEKQADVIYNQMVVADSNEVASISSNIMKLIKNESVANQVLGLTSTLVCLLDQYGLSHINALAEANNIVYSDGDSNMLPNFKVITELMKRKWELN